MLPFTIISGLMKPTTLLLPIVAFSNILAYGRLKFIVAMVALNIFEAATAGSNGLITLIEEDTERLLDNEGYTRRQAKVLLD